MVFTNLFFRFYFILRFLKCSNCTQEVIIMKLLGGFSKYLKVAFGWCSFIFSQSLGPGWIVRLICPRSPTWPMSSLPGNWGHCTKSLQRAKFLSDYPGRSQCPDNYYISMVLSLCCFPCMIAEMGQCVESKNFSNQATNHDFNNIVWPLDLKTPSNISGIHGRSELGSMDILTVHIFIWNKLMNKCSCCSPMILIS